MSKNSKIKRTERRAEERAKQAQREVNLAALAVEFAKLDKSIKARRLV